MFSVYCIVPVDQKSTCFPQNHGVHFNPYVWLEYIYIQSCLWSHWENVWPVSSVLVCLCFCSKVLITHGHKTVIVVYSLVVYSLLVNALLFLSFCVCAVCVSVSVCVSEWIIIQVHCVWMNYSSSQLHDFQQYTEALPASIVTNWLWHWTQVKPLLLAYTHTYLLLLMTLKVWAYWWFQYKWIQLFILTWCGLCLGILCNGRWW